MIVCSEVSLLGQSFMGIGSYFKRTVKANTNVTGWVSWNAIRNNANVVGRFIRDIKAPKTSPKTNESFEEAIKRYGLSEQDLRARMRSYFRVAILCVALGVLAFLWMIYLFIKEMIFPGFVALALASLMFSYGFREHFQYFQIQQRRLGCTVREWFSSFISRKRLRK